MKKSTKTVLSFLVGGLLVGVIAFGSGGFKDWDAASWKDKFIPSREDVDPSSEDPSEEEIVKTNVQLLEFTSTKSNSKLTPTTVVSYFNSSVSTGPVSRLGNMEDLAEEDNGYDLEYFASNSEYRTDTATTYDQDYVMNAAFEDVYLKFGSSSKTGFVYLLLNDYSFTHIKVVARPYGSLNGQTGIWSADTAALEVNGHAFPQFITNADDTTKPSPWQDLEFSYSEAQDHLLLNSLGKRVQILSIEMWTQAQ